MRLTFFVRLITLCALCAVGLLGGCASSANNPDPYEKTNRFFYKVNDGLDRVALKPASDLYVKIIPQPIRAGLGNAFDNLKYGNVILNDLLQGKWGQGLGDTGRMAVNTTFGIAGVFDVATHWKLPVHSNDFGLTLAKWGNGPGPYLFLPLFGPSSVRDAPGLGVELLTNPVLWVDAPWAATIPLTTTDIIDERSRAELGIKFRSAAALDPYVFTREAYLQYRQSLIHGPLPHPNAGLYDEDFGPTSKSSATQPATAPGGR